MTRCLDALIKYSINAGVQLRVDKRFSSLIALSRNQSAQAAVDSEFDYLLFIDSDMVFGEDFLVRMLKRDKGVLSALAVNRMGKHEPVCRVLNADGDYEPRKNLTEGRFYSDLDMLGCGFLLIKTEVFKKLKKPYFAMPPFKESIMGEDVYFCSKAKEAGYDICLDTELSCGHIGEYIYTINDYEEEDR